MVYRAGYFIALLVVASFFLLSSQPSFAADTETEIRPSHLLAVETGGTRPQKTLVVSAFNTGSRVAYGMTDYFETRADLYLKSVLSPSATQFGFGVTEKFRVIGNDIFGVAAQATFSSAKTLADSSTTNNGTVIIPCSAHVGGFLFTVNPLLTQGFDSGAKTGIGTEFGIAYSVLSFAGLIFEGSYISRDSVGTTSWSAGAAFKPANRITIPVVVAAREANTTSVGLLQVFAHIGFQL